MTVCSCSMSSHPDWQFTRPSRANSRREQMQQKKPLLDHLVGAGEQREGDVEAKRFRCCLVDDEFELGR